MIYLQHLSRRLPYHLKIDESITGQDEAQAMYTHMRQMNEEYCPQAMTLFCSII